MAAGKENDCVVGEANDVLKEKRPKWDNKFQYVLSCVGLAVGLGNVWRFPNLCQTYGGGAFLIPYIIALIFEGIPILHIELAIGQRLRKGSFGVWNSISPYLGGVGIASLLISFLLSMYYNTILAWILWYLLHSVEEPLPWKNCPLNNNGTGFVEECEQSTPVDYFWYRNTLNISPEITTKGDGQLWWLVICLIAAWLIVYACVIRGIETMGKAIYFTATFPYLVLIILLAQGLTLPGAIHGLTYLITPDLKVLTQPRVWLDAATQIFFSLSLGFGGLIAFSSYNSPKNDCEVDAVTVAVVNSITSIFASVPIFCVLGFKATTAYWDCLDSNILLISNEFEIQDGNVTRDNYFSWMNDLNVTHHDRILALPLKSCVLKDFLDQSTSGTGLAFIVFTEAIVRMPVSQIWAVLFFVMLFNLGLSSMFGNVVGILTPLLDLKVFPKCVPKEIISAIICLICFSVALTFTTASGSYWLTIFDNYGTALPLLIVAFFELIGVIYVYGFRKFCDDLEFMTGRRPNFYWQVAWRFISPLLLLSVFVTFVATEIQSHLSYEAWDPNYVEFPKKEEKEYTGWVEFICAFLVILSSIFIPLTALYHFIRLKLRRHKQTTQVPFDNLAFQL
ncbi:sodium-dependent neutral amino acid transporter B(0)AT3-like [Hemiscyllium ocellatum]|uniref:sodium-dependent neutral amino acid transporter B(0)AT3-like n=1 Tax=Hemiscyllium ocellatum TaxID=170820 RepID=UPI00296629F5|nr:sodium-dependent neutral amino acid transporter B(0)AT3-like [Hemiscyllium ocellatum]